MNKKHGFWAVGLPAALKDGKQIVISVILATTRGESQIKQQSPEAFIFHSDFRSATETEPF